MKPIDFNCIVKCSKSQLTENGFKDAVINEIYGGILECLHYNSSKIAFPELIVPALVQMRSFVKRSRIANYTKKIKQLLDKTNENVQFVLANRRKVNEKETQKVMSDQVNVNDYDFIPKINKDKKTKVKKEFKGIFEEDGKDDSVHRPPDALEVASD